MNFTQTFKKTLASYRARCVKKTDRASRSLFQITGVFCFLFSYVSQANP